jgi:DNA-binding MarR family transcriptional regulator
MNIDEHKNFDFTANDTDISSRTDQIKIMNLQNQIDAQIEKGASDDADKDINAQDVLFVLRQIIHATDKQSRNMVGKIGITGPQYALLCAIRDLGEVTTRQLSDHISLTQATVTTILDRLQTRGLIERYRSEKDRRIVHSRLSGDSEALLKQAPKLMQVQFSEQFEALSKTRQREIFESFAQVAKFMGAEKEEPSSMLISPEEQAT